MAGLGGANKLSGGKAIGIGLGVGRFAAKNKGKQPKRQSSGLGGFNKAKGKAGNETNSPVIGQKKK